MAKEWLHVRLEDPKQQNSQTQWFRLRDAVGPYYRDGLTDDALYEQLGPKGNGVSIAFKPRCESNPAGQRQAAIAFLSQFPEFILTVHDEIDEN